MTATGAPASGILSLPSDILAMLPSFVHNIEDYMTLSSTCSSFRHFFSRSTPSNQILRLAAAQGSTFFRPDPLFLLAAVSRELGHWARSSPENEARFCEACQTGGAQGLLDLAVSPSPGGASCRLSMQRIRELHLLRFSAINPVSDIIDKCVGRQWYSTPNFWDGGVDDAYTISAEPADTLFHWLIYGELFSPDFDAVLTPQCPSSSSSPSSSSLPSPILSLSTRLEFIKYCLPDFACHLHGRYSPKKNTLVDRGRAIDPRRLVRDDVGPYHIPKGGNNSTSYPSHNNNQLALIWTLASSRWRPHWHKLRKAAGLEDFQGDFDEAWHDEDPAGGADGSPPRWDWRQRLLEGMLTCRGYDSLIMLAFAIKLPGAEVAEVAEVAEAAAAAVRDTKDAPSGTGQDVSGGDAQSSSSRHDGSSRRPDDPDHAKMLALFSSARESRDKIAQLLDNMRPEAVRIGTQFTFEYPFLLGDLSVCTSGYVGGT